MTSALLVFIGFGLGVIFSAGVVFWLLYAAYQKGKRG